MSDNTAGDQPAPINSPLTEYERLQAFTRLLWDVAEMLRVRGRTDAADVVHGEAVHFAGERDIAREMADAEHDLQNPILSVDLGRLDDDDETDTMGGTTSSE